MYKPGYQFNVSARFRAGELVSYTELWDAPFVERTPATLPVALLDDGERVTVVRNDNGRIVVRRQDGTHGYLG